MAGRGVGGRFVDGGHCGVGVCVDWSVVDGGVCTTGVCLDQSAVDEELYSGGGGGSTADVDNAGVAVTVGVTVTVTAGDTGNKTAKAPGALAAAQRDIASDRARWSGDRPHARPPAPFIPPRCRPCFCGGAVVTETSGCW